VDKLVATAVARELFLDKGARPSAKIGNAKQRSTLELESLFIPITSKQAFSKKK